MNEIPDDWIGIQMPESFNTNELMTWLLLNVEDVDEYRVGIYYCFFKNDKDAVLFTMRWG